jgi:hypothetical protein
MIAFIDEHREVYGVEPICKLLPIAPSTYYTHAGRRADPGKLPARAKSDAALVVEIRRVFEENYCVYGVRKVWRQLGREGISVARCTVARLMRTMGLQGAVRGKPVRTTISGRIAPCPLDRVNRQFRVLRPNALWVSDFTYVATWAGFVYVAFVIDAFARRIVGWRVSRSAHAGFVLDALEQALHERRPIRGGLVHHSDRGVQPWVQVVVATPVCAARSAASKASAGVLQPRVLRGRPLRAAVTAARSSALCPLRSVPFGKYCRSSPLVFSFVPRCHGLCGSQK